MGNVHNMTLAELADRASRAGSYWFTPDTMRFFGSRVSESTIRRLPDADGCEVWRFVSSETDAHGEDRRYSVREIRFWGEWKESLGRAVERCTVDTLGDFRGYATSREAKRDAYLPASAFGER